MVIDQALFGYEDGHRLLAGSTLLDAQSQSVLLPASDLAPGVDGGRRQDYWTGLPLAARQQYALMHTWTAPEMPRPGCVWTHVLLVSFADLGVFRDLDVLADRTVRPEVGSGFAPYAGQIRFEAPFRNADGEAFAIPLGQAITALRATYPTGRGDALPPVVNLPHLVAFAIWSQQWPQLRSSFSFRTLPAKTGAHPIVRDDPSHPGSDTEAWEVAAVNDLRSRGGTQFRRFLWQYGDDTRGGTVWFRFLSALYVGTRAGDLSGSALQEVLSGVASAVPNPSDGVALKRGLLAGEDSARSLLPEVDWLEATSHLLQNDSQRTAFRPQIRETCSRLSEYWPARSDEALSLAERALDRDPEVGTAIADVLARLVESATFVSVTAAWPRVRAALLKINPALLNSPELETVGVETLLGLLEFIPSQDLALARAVVDRLLRADEALVARSVLRRLPDITTRLILKRTDSRGEQSRVASAWLEALAAEPDLALSSSFSESSPSLSAVARLAGILGYDTPQVLRSGSLPWAKMVTSGADDLASHERLRFLAFLLVVAIRKPAPGCERLFELSFEPVHRALQNSSLPWDTYRMVARHLPDLSWWDNWDNCRRLRIAVVRSFVNAGLAPGSFHRLTSNRQLLDSLKRVATESEDGRSFLNRLA